MSQLITGEAVALDLRPARLPSRILARIIDLAAEGIAFAIVLQIMGSLLTVSDFDFAFAIGIVLLVAFVVGYPTAFETLWRGLTPGKAALGIRVVRDDGGPVRFRHALTRGLFNIVDLWLTFGSAAMISSLLSRRGKRLGDLAAGTFVIQERLPRQRLIPVYMPPALAPWAATLDLSRLPDDLALAVRGYLGRAPQLRPEARERLGAELGAAVASYVTPPPPPGTPGWAYLAAVVAERRRRDEARMPSRMPGWQPPPPTPGWGTSPPTLHWGASAPSTGAPPPVGPPPTVGAPPRDPGPPRLPSAPSPQWGPTPVPPPAPPPPPPAPAPLPAPPRAPAAAPAPASGPAPPGDGAPERTPEPAPEDGFALPG